MPDHHSPRRGITRRGSLLALAALPITGLLPMLPAAAGGRLKNVAFRTEAGHLVAGALAEPAAEHAPAVILIHDLGGLDSAGRAVAAGLAEEGFLAFAIDLFGFMVDPAMDPATLIQSIDSAAATDKLTATAAWLSTHERSSGRIGVAGWGYGGGWASTLAVKAPVAATVIYYGDVGPAAAAVADLAGPVLGHFAERDPIMNHDLVGGLETAMADAGKADQLTVWWYDASRGFADRESPRYVAASADLAWQRTLAFLKASLA